MNSLSQDIHKYLEEVRWEWADRDGLPAFTESATDEITYRIIAILQEHGLVPYGN